MYKQCSPILVISNTLDMYIKWTRILGWNQKTSLMFFFSSHYLFKILFSGKISFPRMDKSNSNPRSSWLLKGKSQFEDDFNFQTSSWVSYSCGGPRSSKDELLFNFSFSHFWVFLSLHESQDSNSLDLDRGKRGREGGARTFLLTGPISGWWCYYWSNVKRAHRAIFRILWCPPPAPIWAMSPFLFFLCPGDTRHRLLVQEGSAVSRLLSWAVSTYGPWDLHTFELSLEGSIFTS